MQGARVGTSSVELGAEASLEEGESYDEAMDQLYNTLGDDMKRAFLLVQTGNGGIPHPGSSAKEVGE